MWFGILTPEAVLLGIFLLTSSTSLTLTGFEKCSGIKTFFLVSWYLEVLNNTV